VAGEKSGSTGSQRGHVREDLLAGAALQLLNGESPALKASAQEHLARCARCTARLEELRGELAGERQDGAEAADAVFSDERLRAQRLAILRRLERDRARARVLAFPAAGPWLARRDRPAMRWLAGAAAAGLLVGLIGGQLMFAGHSFRLRPSSEATRWTAASWLDRPSGGETPGIERLSPAAEEAFLSDIELAVSSRRIAALQALDDLTPRTSERPSAPARK
jgi:hypothetical protein